MKDQTGFVQGGETGKLLEFAIEAAELGTWELNPLTSTFTGNSRLKKWFGVEKDGAIDLNMVINLIAARDRAAVITAINKALDYQSGGNYDIEYAILNAVTGKEIIVKAKGKAYFNADKIAYTFSGILMDVTEEANIRKQLDLELIEQKSGREKLAESEAHLQLLRDTVPAMIFYLDASQRYQSYNGVFMKWFNISADEALGKTIKEFLGEAAYKSALPYLTRAYAGEPVRYELHAPARMNASKWLDIVYTPHLNKEGKVAGIIVHAMDITQSKETEILLRNSEVRFRSLIADAPVATCLLTGRELKVEIANEMMLTYWKKPADVIGMRLEDALPEIKGQPFLQILDRVYTTGNAYNEIAAETQLIFAGEQKTFYFNYTYKPLRDDQGQVYGILNMAIDVTDQIITQKRIEESEYFANNIIFNSPVAKIVYMGEEMKISVVNENMLQLLGRDESIIGKTFTEAVPELANSVIEERMRKVLHTGEMYSQAEEAIQLNRFGKPYTGYYNYVYKALKNTTGAIYGIMATATEVTEQVVVRKKIEGNEKELRDLINASPIGICVLKGSDARIVEVNEKFIAISGKEPALFKHANYWDIFPEVATYFAPILQDVFATGNKYTTEEMEMTLIRAGVPEKIFATFEYVPVFDIDNVVAKVIVIVIEVTHQVETRKKIEEAVIERTRELAASNLNLTRSNAELEQFAYIASHDLQEPVRKISTFLQMLEFSLGNIPDKSKEYIGKIYSSTDRMTNLIRDVLAYSIISQTPEKPEAVDLNKIIDIVKGELELQIEKKAAIFHINNLPVIYGSATQLTQLFANLVSNALKFNRQGVQPLIAISCEYATADAIAKHPVLLKGKNYFHITVTDNGIGFDVEHAERIFKIFQRLHGKKEFEGTGIGLSICKKIVQSHHGHISAAQGKNGGAVFHILLPAQSF